MDWGEGGGRLCTCTCIKMGINESYFNVSLIVRDTVTIKTCPQTTTVEEKGESKRIRT